MLIKQKSIDFSKKYVSLNRCNQNNTLPSFKILKGKKYLHQKYIIVVHPINFHKACEENKRDSVGYI